jgi:hypothetical protein
VLWPDEGGRAGRAAAALAGLAFGLVARPARADPEPDTTYGRVEGDVNAALGLGASFGSARARAAIDARIRYLETVGFFATYEDATAFGTAQDLDRLVAGGLEFRPLFLGRWLQGLETGIAPLDLTIDSVGLELGTFFAQPHGESFRGRPGLLAGVGFEIPIAARASGLFLGVTFAGLWSDTALAGAETHGFADRAFALDVRLSWHQVFGAHLVDVGDRVRP